MVLVILTAGMHDMIRMLETGFTRCHAHVNSRALLAAQESQASSPQRQRTWLSINPWMIYMQDGGTRWGLQDAFGREGRNDVWTCLPDPVFGCRRLMLLVLCLGYTALLQPSVGMSPSRSPLSGRTISGVITLTEMYRSLGDSPSMAVIEGYVCRSDHSSFVVY